MSDFGATTKTEAKWAERVRAWRASGETAQEFGARHGFAASTLHGWSSRLSRDEGPRFLRLVPKGTEIDGGHPAAEVVVEIGPARVRVAPGFDATLLADVVRSLAGVAR